MGFLKSLARGAVGATRLTAKGVYYTGKGYVGLYKGIYKGIEVVTIANFETSQNPEPIVTEEDAHNEIYNQGMRDAEAFAEQYAREQEESVMMERAKKEKDKQKKIQAIMEKIANNKIRLGANPSVERIKKYNEIVQKANEKLYSLGVRDTKQLFDQIILSPKE